MKKFLYTLTLTIILASCLSFPELTSKSFEEVNSVEVKLIQRNKKDTIIKSAYEIKHNLAGDTCLLLETTNTFDLSYKTGIAFRLWANRINPEGYSFYGPYPTMGLLSNLKSVSVYLIGTSESINITSYLTGDSTLTEYRWKKINFKNSASHHLSNNCFKSLYFESLDHFCNSINNSPEKFKGVTKYEYIFWLREDFKIPENFNPIGLKIKIRKSLWPPKNREGELISNQIKINSL